MFRALESFLRLTSVVTVARRPLGCSCACSYHTAPAYWRDVELDKNPFYDKYKQKLQHVVSNVKQKDEGADPTSNNVDHVILKTDSVPVEDNSSSHYSYTRPPQLHNVMKVELLVDKNADEIAQIWKTYHSGKDSICAIIPAQLYSEMISTAQQCPMFIHPLPRSGGFEMILSQFDCHCCHFTSLLNYKSHREAAPIWLTLTHYVDLLDSKGIVLMAGDVDKKYLSVLEAQFLANQIQLYYATGNKDRRNILTQFNHKPEIFDHTKLFELLPQSEANNSK